MRKISREQKKKILIGIAAAALLLAIVGVVQVIGIVRELPRPEKMTSFQPVQSTKIYDRTGQTLLYEIHGDQNRTLVAADKIPLYAKQATIAAEDQGFYDHSALDWKGTLRAVFVNIAKGEFAQGGSTITQQLVKNTFLTPEKTIKRKIKELILAYWIENHYSKDDILTYYMNQIPYGANAYGIEAASTLYFGKSAQDLTVAQSAALASMIKSPSHYSPWGSYKNDLLQRKDYVLGQMEKLGFISQEQLKQALQEQLAFQPQNLGAIKAPHFVMMVKDYLTSKYGDELVEKGGLKVITTLDWKKQQAAEEAVKAGAERNTQLYKGTNAALVAQDPKTGQLLALVGSADYFNKDIDGNFNVAAQGLRQPGSAFKPITYLAAFEKGYTPDTVVFDVKTDFNTTGNPSMSYVPENYDGIYRGPVALRDALAQSLNVPAVKVLYLTGLKNAIAAAQQLGITTLTNQSRYGLSLVLGGGEVKLTDLVEAYSVFAQDGTKHDQSFILQVQDSQGKTLEEFQDRSEQIVDPQYVRMLNGILSDANLRAPLFHASLGLTQFEGYQVAMKTGTTNDYRDAWTMGYSPFLTVGVWAGNSNNKPMQRNAGSILAAVPIWSDFMRKALADYPAEAFPQANPVQSAVPMVNGTFNVPTDRSGNPNPQMHSILWYINKDNPQQPQDGSYNPASDPQFPNWEGPVLEWARANVPNFDQTYNH
jgi:1A family penicillin-binding protein